MEVLQNNPTTTPGIGILHISEAEPLELFGFHRMALPRQVRTPMAEMCLVLSSSFFVLHVSPGLRRSPISPIRPRGNPNRQELVSKPGSIGCLLAEQKNLGPGKDPRVRWKAGRFRLTVPRQFQISLEVRLAKPLKECFEPRFFSSARFFYRVHSGLSVSAVPLRPLAALVGRGNGRPPSTRCRTTATSACAADVLWYRTYS